MSPASWRGSRIFVSSAKFPELCCLNGNVSLHGASPVASKADGHTHVDGSLKLHTASVWALECDLDGEIAIRFGDFSEALIAGLCRAGRPLRQRAILAQ